MSNTDTYVSGAEAPKWSDDSALQDPVAGLLHLPIEDRDYLNTYTLSTCDNKLQELLNYINDPVGKP